MDTLKHTLHTPSSIRLIRRARVAPIIKRMLFYDKKALAARISAEMSRLHITNSEIAELCGVSLQAVTGWLKTGRVKHEHIETLAKRFGRSMAWMLVGDQGMSSLAEDERLTPRQLAVLGLLDGLTDEQQEEFFRELQEAKRRNDALYEALSKRRGSA